MFWPDGVESLVMNQEWNSDVTYKEIQNEIYNSTKKKIGKKDFPSQNEKKTRKNLSNIQILSRFQIVLKLSQISRRKII